MTLQQMYDLANRKSYFSRSANEIWQAISCAQNSLYFKVMKERKEFWRTKDTSSLALAAGQEEYPLPQAVGEILRLRWQVSPGADWQLILPADITDDSVAGAQSYSDSSVAWDGPISPYVYEGPYLDNTSALTTAQVQKISIEPIPTQAGACELIYVAKCVDITGPGSPLIMPGEGHDAMLFGAVAQLLTDNGDNPAMMLAQEREEETGFLSWARRRQFQGPVVSIEPYISDLD